MDNAIQIELFRDAECPEIPMDVAVAGLNIVQSVVGAMRVIATDRMLSFGRSGQTIVSDDFPRHILTAPLNLLITERPLLSTPSSGKSTAAYGLALGSILRPGQKSMAVVDVSRAPAPKITVAHELGHMLGLKTAGKTHDGKQHCIDETCYMAPHHKTTRVETRHVQGEAVIPAEYCPKSGAILSEEIILPVRSRITTGVKALRQQFCCECTNQLMHNVRGFQRSLQT